jgi:short-subunit dehydrogenase
MRRTLRNSVVVITGASSGIGRATALEFARRGARVVVSARRAGPLEDVARECRQYGARAISIATDVTDESAVELLARQTVETFGQIDVWVNNAAVTLFGRFEDTPPDLYRRVIETNVLGTVHGARAAMRQFTTGGSGVLINVGSVVSYLGQPYASAYAMSKHAIRAFSECLRQEQQLFGRDIHVCTVMPASIDTPIFQHAGNYTGRAVQPMPPVYQAEKAARTIVSLGEHPRREVFVGNAARLMAWMHALAPGLVERRMARKVDREHLADRPAPHQPGNILEPTPQWTSIGGGWRGGEGRWTRRVATAAAVALPVAAALYWRRSSTKQSLL